MIYVIEEKEKPSSHWIIYKTFFKGSADLAWNTYMQRSSRLNVFAVRLRKVENLHCHYSSD